MDGELISFLVVLSLVWFLIYWVLGGVFFAVVTLVRLGRLRKVRFSCLFSLLALGLGIGTAIVGVRGSQEAVSECLMDATTSAEKVTAVFGCGFASIFGTFLLGAFLLTIGGFFIMTISRSKTKPWITFEPIEEGEEIESVAGEEDEYSSKSQFF